MIRTQAIILATRPHKEHDVLVSCYTKDFGKRTVVARGAKKPLSKFAPFLHPLSVVRCGFIEGRSFPVLIDIDSLFVAPFAEDVAAFFALCDAICYEGQRDSHIWNLLLEALAGGGAEGDYARWATRLYSEAGLPAGRQTL